MTGAVVAFTWSSVPCPARPVHTRRMAASLVPAGPSSSSRRAHLLFGQSQSGRHAQGLSTFDADRATWHDWPAEHCADGPCARWGAAVCAVGENDVFCFGGEDWLREHRDAWLWLAREARWVRLPLASVAEPLRSPQQRMCAVAVALDARLVVVSGGVTRLRGRRVSSMLNEFWLVDTLAEAADDVWTRVKVTGDFVVPRESHSVLLDKDAHRLVLFGGSTLRAQMHPQHELFVAAGDDNGDHLLNDVVYVDLKTWRARVVEADGLSAVPPRQGHAAMIVRSQRLMVVCGGETTAARARTNAVHVYHLDLESWLQEVRVGGRVPPPWSFAASCAFEADESLLVVGGFNTIQAPAMRLQLSAPPSLAELCARVVARAPPPVLPRVRWAARVQQLLEAAPAGYKLSPSIMYKCELHAFFQDIVHHLSTEVDAATPATMRLWHDSRVPQRLSTVLALRVADFADDEELVAAFRQAAAFALAQYTSLFGIEEAEEADDIAETAE